MEASFAGSAHALSVFITSLSLLREVTLSNQRGKDEHEKNRQENGYRKEGKREVNQKEILLTLV